MTVCMKTAFGPVHRKTENLDKKAQSFTCFDLLCSMREVRLKGPCQVEGRLQKPLPSGLLRQCSRWDQSPPRGCSPPCLLACSSNNNSGSNCWFSSSLLCSSSSSSSCSSRFATVDGSLLYDLGFVLLPPVCWICWIWLSGHAKACKAFRLNHCRMAVSAHGLATSLVSQAVGTHRDMYC